MKNLTMETRRRGEQVVKVESGIPIWPDGRGIKNRKYPFFTMQIGESFVMKRESRSGCIAWAQKKTGRKLTVRSLGDGTYRVWRTA